MIPSSVTTVPPLELGGDAETVTRSPRLNVIGFLADQYVQENIGGIRRPPGSDQAGAGRQGFGGFWDLCRFAVEADQGAEPAIVGVGEAVFGFRWTIERSQLPSGAENQTRVMFS